MAIVVASHTRAHRAFQGVFGGWTTPANRGKQRKVNNKRMLGKLLSVRSDGFNKFGEVSKKTSNDSKENKRAGPYQLLE